MKGFLTRVDYCSLVEFDGQELIDRLEVLKKTKIEEDSCLEALASSICTHVHERFNFVCGDFEDLGIEPVNGRNMLEEELAILEVSPGVIDRYLGYYDVIEFRYLNSWIKAEEILHPQITPYTLLHHPEIPRSQRSLHLRFQTTQSEWRYGHLEFHELSPLAQAAKHRELARIARQGYRIAPSQVQVLHLSSTAVDRPASLSIEEMEALDQKLQRISLINQLIY